MKIEKTTDYFIWDDRDAGIAAMKSGVKISILNYGDILSHIKEHSEGLGINRKTEWPENSVFRESLNDCLKK